MSFTITPDEGDDFNTTYHVRATLATRADFEALIAALTRRTPSGSAQEESHEYSNDPTQPVRPSLPTPGVRTGCTGAHTQITDGLFRSFRGD